MGSDGELVRPISVVRDVTPDCLPSGGHDLALVSRWRFQHENRRLTVEVNPTREEAMSVRFSVMIDGIHIIQ